MIGLPSLHTLDRAQAARIWLASEVTDMRCGFDRLAERVRTVIGQDPAGGHLFVFRSATANERSRYVDGLKANSWRRSERMPGTYISKAYLPGTRSQVCSSRLSPRGYRGPDSLLLLFLLDWLFRNPHQDRPGPDDRTRFCRLRGLSVGGTHCHGHA